MAEQANEIEMADLPKIIACPHCKDGGHPKLTTWSELECVEDEGDEPVFTVVCAFTEGGCGATGGCASDPKLAIDLWNMRGVMGYEGCTWYGVPYEEACKVLRKALMDKNNECVMEPHPDYDLVTCSKCGFEVEYDGNFCRNCGAPVKGGACK